MTDAMSLAAQTDVPTLWERAKAMFATVRDAFDTGVGLVTGSRERRTFLSRLKPVEKIVRTLMLVDAFTWLMMTPEGCRLRATTPKVEPTVPPQPTAAPSVATANYSTRILMPGWHTIAAFHPSIAEREKREALERQLAKAETQAKAAAQEKLRSAFHVFGWRHERDPEPAPPLTPPRKMFYREAHHPILPSMVIAEPRKTIPPAPTGDALARRLAALSRILANPTPAIRRLARRLAAIPLDCIPSAPPWKCRPRRLIPEHQGARSHLILTIRTYLRTERWRTGPPDPD